MNHTSLKKRYILSQFYLLGISLLFSAGLYAAEDACSKGFYTTISQELNKAYNELGKPAVNFRNLGVVKDMAVSRLESRASSWPKRATYSISVLSDGISVATFCSDKSTKGTWTPKK